jgi:hypothetical protein
MRPKPDQDPFLANVRAALDGHAADLDEISVARLRAARRRAVDSAADRWAVADGLREVRGWLGLHPWQGGVLGGVTVALLTVALWQILPPEAGTDPVSDVDVELLSNVEQLDLYENLEFYEWLSSQPNAG